MSAIPPIGKRKQPIYKQNPKLKYDLTIVGAGVMAAALLYHLSKTRSDFKQLNILVIESQPEAGKDASNSLNNAGTPHGGNNEPYPPEKAIDIYKKRTFSVIEFLAMENDGILPRGQYLHPSSHCSVALDDDAKEVLQERYDITSKTPYFSSKKILTTEESSLHIPLVNRDGLVTEVSRPFVGDIDFGGITRDTLNHFQAFENITFMTNTSVQKILKNSDNENEDSSAYTLQMKRKNETGDEAYEYLESSTDKLLVLAGGSSLSLLKQSDLGEKGNEKAKEYNVMPVGGEFLITFNPEITSQHDAKVYEVRGKSSNGPPMSDPHLDTRNVSEKSLREKLSPQRNKDLDAAIESGNIIRNPETGNIKVVLFGPFPSMKFSYSSASENKQWNILTDMFNNPVSVSKAMLLAGIKNPNLISYLAIELGKKYFQGKTGKINSLQRFMEEKVDATDWDIYEAGIRAQIIKLGGNVEFGTEIVEFSDSLIALLGASPGATTSPSTAYDMAEMIGLGQNIPDEEVDIPFYKEAKILKMAETKYDANGNIIISEKERSAYAKIVDYKEGRENYYSLLKAGNEVGV